MFWRISSAPEQSRYTLAVQALLLYHEACKLLIKPSADCLAQGGGLVGWLIASWPQTGWTLLMFQCGNRDLLGSASQFFCLLYLFLFFYFFVLVLFSFFFSSSFFPAFSFY